MSIEDRDYMRDRNRTSDLEARRFHTSEQQKARQSEQLKSRFSKYSRASRGLAAPKARRSRFFLIALVLVIGATLWTHLPDIPARFLTRHGNPPFPATGAVRWFIPVAVNGVGDVAPLTITGLAEAGQHVVVKLDTWGAHAPIAMIPIFEPLEFYRAGNRLMGHRIDLGGRINGNFQIRRSSFF